MTESIPLSELQGGTAAKWDAVGDRYVGRIVSMDQRQQTNTEGQPLSWTDGSPRMQWVIAIEQADGEVANLYAKGGTFVPVTGTGKAMLVAIGEAVKAAGGTALRVGDELAVAFTGLGEAKGGKNAPKLYQAAYKLAAAAPASVPVADLFSEA
jgi:hypothetical protein